MDVSTPLPPAAAVSGPPIAGASERILTPAALAFVADLARTFEPRRQALLAARQDRWARLRAGELPDFLPETAAVREATWQVAPAPADLTDRRVEITGPTDRKMLINALNSGAKVFMADLEDATSPTWANVVEGQANLYDAVRRQLDFTSVEGKAYALHAETATLVVRPRGWHLDEKHVAVDGQPVSGSLFDFGLYFFHNAQALLDRGTGPYFYLPKLEGHLEARLWNDVFVHAQRALGIPQGTIRATVLIETILAAFEMDEILFELRDHAAGLNAGRWDYIFSLIKKLGHAPRFMLPDRAQVTMAQPFMKAYCQLLVTTCHRRHAHAMGGMSAFIPNRRDHDVNEVALAKVREDKEREAGLAFDGTWVAHPDLVPVAQAVFDRVLDGRPHQKDRWLEDHGVTAASLLDVAIDGGVVSELGMRANIHVALVYLAEWLAGRGAVPIHNLMEDAATAEIARAQLWQWVHLKPVMADGHAASAELYKLLRDDEVRRLSGDGRIPAAASLLDELVLSKDFAEFLTIPAYAHL